MKKKIDLSGKKSEELKADVSDLRAKLRALAFKAVGATAATANEKRALRKNIARLLTALRTQERVGASHEVDKS